MNRWNAIPPGNPPSAFSEKTPISASSLAKTLAFILAFILAFSVFSPTSTRAISLDIPKITSEPNDCVVSLGEVASFKVTASGHGTLEYAWQYQDKLDSSWKYVPEVFVNMSGADSNTLKITCADLTFHNEVFRCVVTSDFGVVYSKSAKLTIKDALPKIDTNPSSLTVNTGETAKFTVSASGPGPLEYQWQTRSSEAEEWSYVPNHIFPTALCQYIRLS